MPYLPPETIANYIGSGPGPVSMQLAVRRWGLLVWEIMDLELRFNRMLVGLTAEWSGQVSLQVIAAAQPLLQWLHDLAHQLGATTNQINRIINAYRHAHHHVVPTAQIDANRTHRALLLANDLLGLNAPEIARLDQQYERYWARNGREWDRYRSLLVKAVSKMTPFAPPSPIANNTGLVTSVSESG